MKQTRILSLLADNEFGVLTRITALIRRSGWNIRSLAVAETMNPAISRITIGVECLVSTLDSVVQRIARMDCVRDAVVCARPGRELAVARLPRGAAAPEGSRALEGDEVEFSGDPAEVDAWCAAVVSLGAVDIARSGVVTLEPSFRPESSTVEVCDGDV